MNFDAPITAYLRDKGIDNARVLESIIVLPLAEGEFHRKIRGVITEDKLDGIVADYLAATNS
jgi:hypothetical protein